MLAELPALPVSPAGVFFARAKCGISRIQRCAPQKKALLLRVSRISRSLHRMPPALKQSLHSKPSTCCRRGTILSPLISVTKAMREILHRSGVVGFLHDGRGRWARPAKTMQTVCPTFCLSCHPTTKPQAAPILFPTASQHPSSHKSRIESADLRHRQAHRLRFRCNLDADERQACCDR